MENETIETELAGALKARLGVIGDRALRESDPGLHLERLREASERIMEIAARLPAGIDPRLRHYLERCSYDKALAWLEGG